MTRIPVSTYRLQFNRSFGFRDAAAIVDYLYKLGITDVYASPVFQARDGSPHGYDVVNHDAINRECGTREDFDVFVNKLRGKGMGLILDVVPNHMAINDPGNGWWQDVLENGPSSPYAIYFDIDWSPPKKDLLNKVHLPVLGDQYGKVLEDRQIRVGYEQGGFFAECYDYVFPLAPGSYPRILSRLLEKAGGAESDPQVLELESIITALKHLPGRTETDAEKVKERKREKEIIKKRLAALLEQQADLQGALQAVLDELNGRKGDPRSFDALEELLEDQAYRLCYWRVAADEINYRRFFDINELAAIRVEEPVVFSSVHAQVFDLVAKGQATGLRIDHVDGLFDPKQYLHDLQRGCALADPDGNGSAPFYVVVEKILVGTEDLDPEWPIYGTTGYDFLNAANGLFVKASNAQAFSMLYRSFTGIVDDFRKQGRASRKFYMLVQMASEVHVLSTKLERIAEQHRWSRDFTLESLRFALREVIACFPVYRTYIRMDDVAVREWEKGYIMQAIREAKKANPATSPSLFDFIGSVLLLNDPDGLSPEQKLARREFLLRFQQLTGPVMAKGIEDTAFYRYYPLLSLNEVGGGHEKFGISTEAFHERNAKRLRSWPHTLNATSTHDTKRGEDVRCRINVLSEIPDEWKSAIRAWRVLNRDKKTRVEGIEAPDANEEYLLYQTLIGAWPVGPMDDRAHGAFVKRIEAYMEKALKEAKIHTSWINPNEAYDQAVRQFVKAVLSRGPKNAFLDSFARFRARIARFGVWNGLGLTLLKMTSPGIPDFYQGTELWTLDLVDPDNRRPVDYSLREQMLKKIVEADENNSARLERELAEAPEDGRAKLFLIYKGLNFRKAHRSLFEDGDYVPLYASPPSRDHLVSFARRKGKEAAIVIVPRFLKQLSATDPIPSSWWKNTSLRLPSGFPVSWINVITGEAHEAPARFHENVLDVSRILRYFPVALLHAKEG